MKTPEFLEVISEKNELEIVIRGSLTVKGLHDLFMIATYDYDLPEHTRVAIKYGLNTHVIFTWGNEQQLTKETLDALSEVFKKGHAVKAKHTGTGEGFYGEKFAPKK